MERAALLSLRHNSIWSMFGALEAVPSPRRNVSNQYVAKWSSGIAFELLRGPTQDGVSRTRSFRTQSLFVGLFLFASEDLSKSR